MDNFYRLSNLTSATNKPPFEPIFNWRSDLFDVNDNTYFLIAKFSLLNKLKFDNINEFFKKYFSFDVYDLDVEGHRSIKYLFSVFSHSIYTQNDFVTDSSTPNDILGLKINLSYGHRAKHHGKTIRYCAECIKYFKLPETASFNYLERCLVHNTKFSEFQCNFQHTRLRERNIKCYENFLIKICPTFPTLCLTKPSTAGKNNNLQIELNKWNSTLKKEAKSKLGKHLHTFKEIDDHESSQLAYTLMIGLLTPPPLLNNYIIKNGKSIIAKFSSIKNEVGLSLFEKYKIAQFNAIRLVYSSFCFLNRRDEASFIKSILDFIDELNLRFEKKTNNFWYFNERDRNWILSDISYRSSSQNVYTLLINWLAELWLPSLYNGSSRRVSESYFNNFYILNHDLVRSGTFRPLVDDLTGLELSFGQIYIYGSRFRELSTPNFSSEQMFALDSIFDEIAKSYISDVRTWIDRIECGEKPDHFPPKSRALLSLQKRQNDYCLISISVD